MRNQAARKSKEFLEKLILNETKILPSILILNEKLEVEWEQKGRNALYFGDPELMKRLQCEGWI